MSDKAPPLRQLAKWYGFCTHRPAQSRTAESDFLPRTSQREIRVQKRSQVRSFSEAVGEIGEELRAAGGGGGHRESALQRVRNFVIGKPRDPTDPGVFHKISLIAFLAWVGLGADGLSSSCYGPEETFKALGDQQYLAVALVLAIAFTVFIISYAYSRIIEHFPFGGGGYVVATKLLGPRLGVTSGSALLVDYVLTISVSIAAGSDALFSFLPPRWLGWKLTVEFAAIVFLMLLNLRGVKESVLALAPIFVTFVITHAVLTIGTITLTGSELPAVSREVHEGFRHGLVTMGFAGMTALFLHAYSMGAGTYTGIEAVSNGLQIMRDPKVETGKRTMLYMALSLALTAAGLTLAYLLIHARPVEGKTMNAVLVERFAAGFGLPGQLFVYVTLVSEAALLVVAAQAGFIDGPRVMSNMANDSWLPHRFRQLSDRLTMQNGVLLISSAALLTLAYTRGNTTTLILMYSINVFLTFSLSESGMVRFWVSHREKYPHWYRHIIIHIIGLILCLSILSVSVYEKFHEGGWITLVTTTLLIGVCFRIRGYYLKALRSLKRLDDVMNMLPANPPVKEIALDPTQPTAVLMVGGYGGLGIHALLSVQRVFPGQFNNFLFVSVAVVDAATMKGIDEVDQTRQRTEEALEKYVRLANRLGFPADSRMSMGTDPVLEAEGLALQIGHEFPRAVFFLGKLIFEEERWYHRLLHNLTAEQIQRKLQFAGLNAMILPVRVIREA